jgi:cytidylate kinase
MGAWQAPLASDAEDQEGSAGGPHGWPHSVVRWLFGLGEELHQPASTPIPVARFQNICISREAGAGGSALARMVGDRLGWKVYDEELIEAIAHRMQVPIDEVRALDEQAPSMVQDWLLPLREEYYAPQEAYLDHLAKLIEAIGRAGESILVGRGAGFMLPRETTLSLRVIAPMKVRAQRLAERMGVSVRTARRAARDLDRRRAQFDRTMHRANPSDPHNFDMVLDTASLSLEIAAEIVVHAAEVGRPGALPLTPSQRGRPDLSTARPPAEAGIPGIGLRGLAAEPADPSRQGSQTAALKVDVERSRGEEAPLHDNPSTRET